MSKLEWNPIVHSGSNNPIQDNTQYYVQNAQQAINMVGQFFQTPQDYYQSIEPKEPTVQEQVKQKVANEVSTITSQNQKEYKNFQPNSTPVTTAPVLTEANKSIEPVIGDNYVQIGKWKRDLLQNGRYDKHKDMIINSALKYGVDPTIMLTMANIESGFDSNAENTYYGGQFAIDKRIHNNWRDPVYNTNEAIKLYKQNEKYFRNKTGQGFNSAGIAYLLHQQGLAGGTSLFKNMNTGKSAVDALTGFYGKQAKKLGMSEKDYIGKYVIESNGGKRDMSAKEFASIWIDKGNAIQEGYKNILNDRLASWNTYLNRG